MNTHEEDELTDMMLHASIDEDEISEETDINDSISVVAADIVAGQQKKKKSKPKDTSQLSLLDDFELLRAGNDASKESGSTGV